MSESLSVTGIIGTIFATDRDTGLNGDVVYAIDSGNDAAHFSLDSNNGVLTLSKLVDFENVNQKFFKLLVAASDLGSPSLQNRTDVSIYVLDFNDNSPIAFDAIGSINENATAGTIAATLTATDADSGDNQRLIYRSVQSIHLYVYIQ